MIKNFFISGRPGTGKTTLIKEILEESNLDAGGFCSSEIREKGVRKGFKIVSLDGEEGTLAHVDIKSPYRVSKYKVNIKDLEEIGVKSVSDALEKNKIIVIDEVGLMELYAEKFRRVVMAALDSKNKVLGTIMLKPNPFCDKIKKRSDTKIFHLTRENRQEVKKEIQKSF